MEENYIVPAEQQKQERPQALTALIIISIVVKAFGALGTLLFLFIGDMYVEFLMKYDPKTAHKMEPLFTDPYYLIPLIVINLVQIVGNIYLWRMRKIGFHIYVIGKFAQLFLPYILYGERFLDPWVILTVIQLAIWPILYATYLKKMR